MATVELDQRTSFIRAPAGSVLGRLALVKRDIASPDRIGFYRGEVVVAEDSRNFSIDLLFANGNVAKRFEVARAAQGERITFNWGGQLNNRAIDHQLLRVTTPGIRMAAVFVWATIAAVRTDKPTCDPVFCTVIGPFQRDDIVRISNDFGP